MALGEEVVHRFQIDFPKCINVRHLNAFIGLVHRPPDHTEFCHWAVIFNEPGIRCPT